MDLGFRFLCQAETRRLISLLGITVVLVLVVQYSELPNTKFLSSLTAKITSFTMDTFSNSTHSLEDIATSPQPSPPIDQGTSLVVYNNSTPSITAIAPSPEKDKGVDNLLVFRNDSSQGIASSLLAPQPMVSLPNRTFLDSEMNSTSSMIPVISTATSVKSNATGSSYADGNSVKSNDKPVVTKKSRKKPSKVVSISEMNLQLQHRHASSNLAAKPASSSAVDLEILHAKSEIENAPNIMDDSRLYSPLYRNVSMFRRSYELMEKMLKVYIYQDGDRPIFHEPLLDGIYASEGWFMKLMEENKQFVTEDPEKAHLFYIPFSSRLLQLTLYVRKSHRRSNLIEYMKNYVDMIAKKYPFWNRTNGTDHFVVACHDWFHQ